MSRLTALLHTERIRAQRVSSDPVNLDISLNFLYQRFRKNGFPHAFIDKHFLNKHIFLDNSQCVKNKNKCDDVVYMKVPFVNELQKRKMIQLRDQHGLTDYLRFIFVTQPPLKRSLRPAKELRPCKDNCISCWTAKEKGKCYKKNVVYEIECCICKKVYIGETGRTIKQRILEHTSQNSSLVKLHMDEHKTNNTNFKWIICRMVPN